MKQKTRILALSHTSDFTGGAEAVLLNIVKNTRDVYDWTVIVPVNRGGFYDKVKEFEGVSVEAVLTPWWCSGSSYGQHISKRNHKQALERISELLEDHDIALTNTITNPWLAYCSGLKGIPHVWYVHEFGNIDHGLEFSLGYKESSKYVDLLSSSVITVSSSVRDHISKNIAKGKISIVPQSVEIDDLDRIADSAKGGTLRILILGSIKPSKGQMILLEALGGLKKSDLNLVECQISGPVVDVPYLKDLKDFASKHDIPVTFKPEFVNSIDEYARSDVVVVPSLNEAFGRTTIEALAAGRIVIGSDSGATKGLLSNSRGYVFKAGDASSLASVIKSVISRGGKDLLSVKDRKNFIKNNFSEAAERKSFIEKIDISLMQNKPVPGGLNYGLLEDMVGCGMYEDDLKYSARRVYIWLRQLAGKLLRKLKFK